MTTAIFTDDGCSKRIDISGHTDSEICSALSVLVNAFINALQEADGRGFVNILFIDTGDGRVAVEYTGDATDIETMLFCGFDLIHENAPEKFVFV